MGNKPEHEPSSYPLGRTGSSVLLLVLASWIALATWSAYSYQAPAVPLAGDESFSANHAIGRLQQILAEGQPHVAGSPAGERVASRISDMLRQLGYEVDTQTGIGQVVRAVRERSPDQQAIPLTNLIASRSTANPAQAPHRKLLVVAHHDSVPYGPGASDNGVGVAALLEIASLIRDRSLRHEVVFLFTDGEELGLLGAKLFMESHPLASQIGIVINLDARGTTGPSLMFETGPRSAGLVPAFGRAVDHPFASSLFFEIYKRLPRDTDFSVFKRAGLDGFNFAFIGNVANYHTPLDDLQHVDLGSLQHHGENVLGLIDALQSSEFDPWFESGDPDSGDQRPADDRLVYFDLFGKQLVWWPEPWSLWMSLAALAAWVATAIVHRPAATPLASAGLRLTGFLVVASLVIWGLLVWFPLHSRLANPWPENPTLLIAGMWLVGLAIAAMMAPRDGSQPSSITGTLVVTGLWVLLALATSIWVCGASYLFVIPALGSSLLSLLAALNESRKLLPLQVTAWTCGAAAILVGLMWIPLERLFYDAVGLSMAEASTFRIVLAMTPLLPLLQTCPPRFRWTSALAAAALSVALFSGSILLAR